MMHFGNGDMENDVFRVVVRTPSQSVNITWMDLDRHAVNRTHQSVSGTASPDINWLTETTNISVNLSLLALFLIHCYGT